MVVQSSKPLVLLIASPGALSIDLVEKLLAKTCSINIHSNKLVEWGGHLHHFSDNQAVKISNSIPSRKIDYFLYVDEGFSFEGGGTSEKSFFESDSYKLIKKLAWTNEAKLMLIFPKVRPPRTAPLGEADTQVKSANKQPRVKNPRFSHNSSKSLFTASVHPRTKQSLHTPLFKSLCESPRFSGSLNENHEEESTATDPLMEVVYLGPMISPRLIDKGSIEGAMIADALIGNTVRLPVNKNAYIYPQTSADVARELSKDLLSFGFVNEKIVFLGKEITLQDFFDVLKRARPAIHPAYELPKIDNKWLISGKVKTVASDLPKAISHIFSYAASSKIPFKELNKSIPPKIVEKSSYKKSHKRRVRPKSKMLGFTEASKKRVALAFISVLIFIFPFVSLMVGASAMLIVAQKSSSFQLRSVQKYMNLSKIAASISIKGLSLYSNIPLLSNVAEPSKDIAQLLLHVTEAGEDVFILGETFQYFSETVLGEGEADVAALTSSAVLTLDSLYRKAGFLSIELKDFNRKYPSLARYVVSTADTEEIRRSLLSTKEFLLSVPDLLGVGSDKRYLVLFQNNMELRPTGGFIGSFALVDFHRGKLSNMSVLDVYSADGQLKGHVEPPGPIKRYLNQASWFLRDSNWDPDFKVSAERAEWFLEKEIDVQVDGVIAIDLLAVKNALGVLGSVYLADFDREITKENMYEVTQYESEKEFFPGSRKKKNFLTALSGEMLTQIQEIDSDKQIPLLAELHKSLGSRNIQIYLHNLEAQEAVSDLGWGGEIKKENCKTENCYSDYLGVVEANLGVNKANYFVSRRGSASVFSSPSPSFASSPSTPSASSSATTGATTSSSFA